MIICCEDSKEQHEPRVVFKLIQEILGEQINWLRVIELYNRRLDLVGLMYERI